MLRKSISAFLATVMVVTGGMCLPLQVQAAQDTAKLDTENVYDLYVAWPSASGAPEDLEEVEEALNNLVGKDIGCNIILSPIAAADLTSQQKLLISSGGALDVVCMLWTGLDTWVNSDCLMELDNLLEDYGSGIKEVLGNSAYGGSFNGHVYGIPTESGGYSYGFLARTDILEEYGYDTADRAITIDELEEMFETIKADKGDGFYCTDAGNFQAINGRYDTLGGSLYTGVVDLNGDTSKIVDPYETEAFKEYAERMYDWAQKGYIAADATTTTDPRTTLLASGNYFGTFSYLTVGTKTGLGSNGAVPLTKLELQPGYTQNGDLINVCWGIASTSEAPEKGMAFLNALYSNPDVSRMLVYGIEGKHYEVVDVDEEHGWEQIRWFDGMDASSVGYYCPYGVWEAGSNTVYESANGYDMLSEKEIRAKYEQSPALGYTFNTLGFETEITALAAAYAEYYRIIDCGAIDPAQELTAFIEALKNAGVDDVVEANQKQYDAWMVSK